VTESLHVVIAGGTGMIGTALTAALFAEGYDVTVLTRVATTKVKRARIATWNPGKTPLDLDSLGPVDAIVNLAGYSLSNMPWTAARKKRILASRVDATTTLVDAIARAAIKPRVFISGSAVGYYGNRGNEALTESSTRGTGFLADVVSAWEDAASKVDPAVRLVIARTGLVIAAEGALTPLRQLARFSLAGPIGRGHQWWPWISLHDEVNALIFAIRNRSMSGVVNLVAPSPATARDVVRTLARRMHRLYWFPTPGFVLRMFLGDAAQEMLLSSQKVVPTHLVASGFVYADETIDRAVVRALRDADRRAI
jgi:uncharacterized protein (TIGR01777 family)